MRDANDFCYWLQGHFELLDVEAQAWSPELSAKAMRALERALKGFEGAQDLGRRAGFCNWMQGYAAAASEAAGGSMPEAAVRKIQARLDQVFEHALPEASVQGRRREAPAKRPSDLLC